MRVHIDQARCDPATLRVDDHDDQGTVASVASILDPELERNPGAVLATGLHISGVDRG